MPETTIIEETVEVLPKDAIVVDGVAAYVVLSLAAYGAQHITRKGIAKTRQIVANRKAKKAEEKAVKANNPPSQ